MLIDTKQIIPLTQLRLRLSQIIDAVEQGRSFVITEKGKIKAKILPPEKKEEEADLMLEELKKLRKENDRYYKRAKKVWSSVQLVRKMREERTKHLLKLSLIHI